MNHLALILPGSGYGPAGPVLLFPSLALQQSGAEHIAVDYPSWRPEGFSPEQLRPFVHEVAESIRAKVSRDGRRWDRITFVAKSLGTLVLSQLDVSGLVNAGELRAIWLTPLLGTGSPRLDDERRQHLIGNVEAQRAGVMEKAWPSLLVAGGADPYHDQAAHDEVVAAIGASSLVIDGADHSLHIDGDVVGTVDGFRRLTEAVLAFDAA